MTEMTRPIQQRPPMSGSDTETLLKFIDGASVTQEALTQLHPGQRVRVIFATAIRQMAECLRTDIALGLRLAETLDSQIEQAVDTMFIPEIFRIHREANEENRTCCDEIHALRATLAERDAEIVKLRTEFAQMLKHLDRIVFAGASLKENIDAVAYRDATGFRLGETVPAYSDFVSAFRSVSATRSRAGDGG